jgi:hypothetical protein
LRIRLKAVSDALGAPSRTRRRALIPVIGPTGAERRPSACGWNRVATAILPLAPELVALVVGRPLLDPGNFIERVLPARLACARRTADR